MAKGKGSKAEQLNILRAAVTTAPCVPSIREAVKQWRSRDYRGASETTQLLLKHWFGSDHVTPSGRRFRYHYFQREATETLIYLVEVAKIETVTQLIETFCSERDLRLLQHDSIPRFAIKMATGSGKTKVMSLAIAWQYFNAVAEGNADFAKSFLVIAPNVIVFERLRSDFAGCRIFQLDPVIPPELKVYWDMQCILRSGAASTSLGAIYLSNIQQFYTRDAARTTEPAAMTGVLGEMEPTSQTVSSALLNSLADRGGMAAIINDEAHHTHEEESEWNAFIRRLAGSPGVRVASQLDFTATPRHAGGQLFSWTVYDYPLKQAIIDNVVKRPLKGVTTGISERHSKIASVQYQAYLVAAVERWREYRKLLKPLAKRPILFVMMNSTQDADDVGDWLRRKYPSDFGDKRLLVIHTDKTGEVSKKDLDIAREVARNVDAETSDVSCIVSVLMLREGWDVSNVTVIVGLRPYSSKAKILPEQTIGRGLRLMFRDATSGYSERVDIIGNRNFISFVEALEREEELDLDTFVVGKDKVVILTIAPDADKADMDIALPQLAPFLTRKKSLTDEINRLNVHDLKVPTFPRKGHDADAQQFRYEGYDLLTLQKIVEREYTIPQPQTAEEVIGYYAKRIAQEVKLPSQFAALVPKVREFLRERAFGEIVDLETPEIIESISSNIAHYVTVKTFADALRSVAIEVNVPTLVDLPRHLSDTRPFPWSKMTHKAQKCIFNLVPCENKLEKDFSVFLQGAQDVRKFAKLPEIFGFSIDYVDARGNLRLYEPDFVACLTDGINYLVETKGREDVGVQNKDRAAEQWCTSATELTGQEWRYLRVPEKEFRKLKADEFRELLFLREVPASLL